MGVVDFNPVISICIGYKKATRSVKRETRVLHMVYYYAV